MAEKPDVEGERYLVHHGVPEGLAEGYRQGKVPNWVLDIAAPPTVVEPSDLAETVVAVEVEKPMMEAPEVQNAIQDFEESLAALPVKAQLQVAPVERIDFTAVPSEELEEVLAEKEIPEVRNEADRRLAKSLPDLSGEENGKLDPALLCPIPWHPSYSLLCAGVPGLERLNEAFKNQFGHDLPIQSAYRSFEQQQQDRKSHV